MIVDAFTHIYPPAYVDVITELGLPLPVFFQNSPSFTDAGARISVMDQYGINMQVLALGTPAFDELFGVERMDDARTAARIANDAIAEIVDAYPNRFIGTATLPLVGLDVVDVALAELERAVTQLGLKGVQLYTSVAGEPLDSPALAPLYEQFVRYDLPVLLHPTDGDYNRRTHDYLLWLTFGWPFETSLAMARLVYSGVLERYPSLKILTHHLGAYPPFMAERIAGVTRTLQNATDWSLPQPVLTYFKRFYGDTAVNGYGPALAAGYEFFGAERILFATDYPFVPIDQTLRGVQQWKLPDREKAQILGNNARTFFNL